jgi:hypothetical protein
MPKALSAACLFSISGLVAAASAVELAFDDFEPGMAPVRSRVLITPRWLRLDNGKLDDNFVLFDRESREIFSVNHTDRSVLHIPAGEDLPAAPESLALELRDAPSPMPKVGEHAVKSYQVLAMGQGCAGFSVAPSLLPDAARAFADYQQALARSSYRRLDSTPMELRTPCFLADNVYAVEMRFGTGMMIAEQRADGRGRLLAGFENEVAVDDALFVLPDYPSYQLPGN